MAPAAVPDHPRAGIESMSQVVFELSVNGQSAVKITIDPMVIGAVWQAAMAAEQTPPVIRSSPLTTEQAQALLGRIDPKSRVFLRRIVENGGSATWREMQEIFGIEDDWNSYSKSYGKGITRSLRNVTGLDGAILVHWDDDDKNWDDDNKAGDCRVFIDGPALEALQAAIKPV